MEDEPKRSEFREKLNGYVNIYSFMSQIIPYCDPALEILYPFGRFLLPHLPLDRESERVKIGDEVGHQYYRLERIYSGEITLKEGEPEGVKSPTDVGTGKAKDAKVRYRKSSRSSTNALAQTSRTKTASSLSKSGRRPPP